MSSINNCNTNRKLQHCFSNRRDADNNYSSSDKIDLMPKSTPSQPMAPSEISTTDTTINAFKSTPSNKFINASLKNRGRCKHRYSSSELDQEARESHLQEAKVYRELLPSNLIISSLMQENDRILKDRRRIDDKRLTSSFDSAITLQIPQHSNKSSKLIESNNDVTKPLQNDDNNCEYRHQPSSTSTAMPTTTTISTTTTTLNNIKINKYIINNTINITQNNNRRRKSMFAATTTTNLIATTSSSTITTCKKQQQNRRQSITTQYTTINEQLMQKQQQQHQRYTIVRENPFDSDIDDLVQMRQRHSQQQSNKRSDMTNNNEFGPDFRHLLYNMICSLLTQDDAILKSHSVKNIISILDKQLTIARHNKTKVDTFVTAATNLSSSNEPQYKTKIFAKDDHHKLSKVERGDKTAGSSNNDIDIDSNNHNNEDRKKQVKQDFEQSKQALNISSQNLLISNSQDEQAAIASYQQSRWSFGHEVMLLDLPLHHHASMKRKQSQQQQVIHKATSSTSNDSACSVGYHKPNHLNSQEDDSCDVNGEFDEHVDKFVHNQDIELDVDSFECINDNSDDYLMSHLDDGDPNASVKRRIKLEWSLNKLIDYEMKMDWLGSTDNLKRSIRKSGIPSEIRNKVWSMLIDQTIASKYDAKLLLGLAQKSLEHPTNNSDIVSIIKQIDLDVNRTMPGHKLFSEGAEGGTKLRLILAAYSIHVNRAIAYCQGFNFIVALLLSVFGGDEQRSLLGFICIVEHMFPSKFYFDHYLTGARADQYLLADLIDDQLVKNSSPNERKMIEGVTSSITLNWFISLFHGAVPTMTRLIILDHFMLDGVKALFKFTMAILYLSFQQTPPTSSEVFMTIRNTAKNMHDVKLLLSIVNQIKLPKDSYFAIRRSFYMVQSSFSSDQFYMQAISNDRRNSTLSKQPPMLHGHHKGANSINMGSSISFAANANLMAANLGNNSSSSTPSSASSTINWQSGPRVCVSLNRSKICIQNIGKLGRSHIKLIDSNVKSYERSLMTPLRNCLVLGVDDCGKRIIMARQTSRKFFKAFYDQDLLFQVHEINSEIFDGFYMEDKQVILIVTKSGEVIKIDTSKISKNDASYNQDNTNIETLMLKDIDCGAGNQNETKIKIELASLDSITNLLWIYLEIEQQTMPDADNQRAIQIPLDNCHPGSNSLKNTNSLLRRNSIMITSPDGHTTATVVPATLLKAAHKSNMPTSQRKIILIDVTTFDIFSAFYVDPNFGHINKMRTSLTAICQLNNPLSNQFSSRIVKVGPTGRYEHLLSFSDVVDFMVTTSNTHSKNNEEKSNMISDIDKCKQSFTFPRMTTPKFEKDNQENPADKLSLSKPSRMIQLMRESISPFRRSLQQSNDEDSHNKYSSSLYRGQMFDKSELGRRHSVNCCSPLGGINRASLASYLDGMDDLLSPRYLPLNMIFIFKNGKIALFEFTESYAIHTRESQLDRYDYSRVIDVSRTNDDFVVTILTIFDKLIKIVI